MTCAAEINLTLCQGATYRRVFRWGQSKITYRPITGATKAAPCVLSVPTHGIPDGWPLLVQSVRGMEELNSQFHYVATVVDSNSIELNSVNALDFTSYSGGGTIAYNTPVDMAGYTARMHIRETLDATTSILTLTTENGGIAIDNTAKTITIIVTSAQTAALDFDAAVYDLEMISAGGEVSRIAYGTVSLSREVTR